MNRDQTNTSKPKENLFGSVRSSEMLIFVRLYVRSVQANVKWTVHSLLLSGKLPMCSYGLPPIKLASLSVEGKMLGRMLT